MKTILIAVLVTLSGCGAEIPPEPVLTFLKGPPGSTQVEADVDQSTDGRTDTEVAVTEDSGITPDTAEDIIPDTAGQDSTEDTAEDTATTDAGTDAGAGPDTTAPPLPCDSPTKDRLDNNFDGTWYDKLLDLDCVFMVTEGYGKRCLPINADNAELGNKDFPLANVTQAGASGLFVTPDCSSGQVTPVKPDLLGHFARFGFVASGTQVGVLVDALNLVDVPETNVLSLNPASGKAQTIKGVYKHFLEGNDVWSCVLTPASPGSTPPGGVGELTGYAGPYNWSLMITGGVASIPECPFMVGLDLFATQK